MNDYFAYGPDSKNNKSMRKFPENHRGKHSEDTVLSEKYFEPFVAQVVLNGMKNLYSIVYCCHICCQGDLCNVSEKLTYEIF